MILIQLRTWFGPSSEAMSSGSKCIEPTETIECVVSRMDVNSALVLLQEYEVEFRKHYRQTAVNFNVIGIQIIDDLSAAALEAGRIGVIEERIETLRSAG